ncbi:MAG: hypothetical protein AAGG99_05395 [Pseudomonadota bacterium]
MTRARLNRTLRKVYVVLGLVLVVALAARMLPHVQIPAIQSIAFMAVGAYEWLRDMAVIIVTLAAAYLANVFQKRSTFIESLRQEWRNIVAAKTRLLAHCDQAYPTTDDFLDAARQISETIDNMRVVYRNVGETERLVGLYPFVPLHDMRRAFATLDPRRATKVPAEHREHVRAAIEQAFYALRERYLEELDLEEPTKPIVSAGARRLKRSGATSAAEARLQAECDWYALHPSRRPDLDTFLSDLALREEARDRTESARLADPPMSEQLQEARARNGTVQRRRLAG